MYFAEACLENSLINSSENPVIYHVNVEMKVIKRNENDTELSWTRLLSPYYVQSENNIFEKMNGKRKLNREPKAKKLRLV